MEHNFWYWLIKGLTDMAVSLVGSLSPHTPTGMNELIYTFLASTISPIVYYVASFINPCWFFLFVGIIATSELVRAVLAAYRTLVKLLPLP